MAARPRTQALRDAPWPDSLRLGRHVDSCEFVTTHYAARPPRPGQAKAAPAWSCVVDTCTYPHVPISAPTVRIACCAFCAATHQDGKIDCIESERGRAAGKPLTGMRALHRNGSAKVRWLNRLPTACRNMSVSGRESSLACVIATRSGAVRFMLICAVSGT